VNAKQEPNANPRENQSDLECIAIKSPKARRVLDELDEPMVPYITIISDAAQLRSGPLDVKEAST